MAATRPLSKKLGRGVVVAAIFGVLCIPAAAEPALQRTNYGGEPSPLDPKLKAAHEELTSRLMHNYARCVVDTKRDDVKRMLADLPDSKEELEVRKRVLDSTTFCLRGTSQMGFSYTLLRGTLAEALYRKLKYNAGSAPAASPSDTYEQFVARLAAADTTGPDVRDYATRMGRWISYCTVTRNPAGVHQMIMAKPMSKGEAAALELLSPTFQSCVARNEAMRFDRLTIRSLLADALYSHQAIRIGGQPNA